MYNIVLLEPEIPNNTGNIVRTCAATGAKLHLIKPLGFEITDKHLKRAGLDYFEFAKVSIYENLEDFKSKNKGEYFFSSTKASKVYSDMPFSDNCYIFFGKETKGLPERLLKENYDRAFRIPMLEGIRSLNLANSVAIVIYDALRRKGFEKMQIKGKLTEV